MGKIAAPVVLNADHLVTQFDCGEASLNDWLKKKAFQNQLSGASKTFVLANKKNEVMGYYTLATGSVERTQATKSMVRNMPNPIPVIILGRLAVDLKSRNQGYGRGLVKEALLRALNVSHQIGVAAVLVHALSPQSKQFYLRLGFRETPLNPYTLMVSIKSIQLTRGFNE